MLEEKNIDVLEHYFSNSLPWSEISSKIYFWCSPSELSLGIVQRLIAVLTPKLSDSMTLGKRQKICVCNKYAGDTEYQGAVDGVDFRTLSLDVMVPKPSHLQDSTTLLQFVLFFF